MSGAGIDEMVRAAGVAANAGRWQEAERLWGEVHKLKPDHPQALYALGVHATQRRDFAAARGFLEGAVKAAPQDMLAWLTLSAVRREVGDATGELTAIDAALAVDPYFLPAMLAKAQALERRGDQRGATFYYSAAVKFALPEARWPPELRPQLLRAKEIAARHAEAFDARLLEASAVARAGLSPAQAERWREAASIMAGRTKPYTSQCNQLQVPRLPAIPFYETAQFPWVAAIEAKTDVIRNELLNALANRKDGFKPYVAYKPGMPVNQWKELNHSDRWAAFQLWRGGEPVAENLALCPETAKALAEVNMAEIAGLCPNAMFSSLAPHTHIPPHTGETNARIVAHLPLIVPDNCVYRVGFEQRRWEVGKVLIFDDTIEHEARNDSDELRVVLIFDIWNPHLAPAEYEVVRSMMQTARSFGAAT
ncbi:MAG: aspartyl/asparaginyl beta-hydroxylase domain-containing protein [Hyphomonadaceae bacterium]|nr:aspartyl/asparaginyl beta-hydroxylase domain-containing protein [Hyphomonadaceae bacterium]